MDGRVWDIEVYSKVKAVCIVDGDTGEYTVTIEVNKKSGELSFECDCPYGEDNFCKHMVAAGLELRDFLRDEDGEVRGR